MKQVEPGRGIMLRQTMHTFLIFAISFEYEAQILNLKTITLYISFL